MTDKEKLIRFYNVAIRGLHIMARIIEDEFDILKKEGDEMNIEKERWHDLRKDPDDLPKTTDTVWVILSENPTEIEMDSYNPDDRGKLITISDYDRETDDGKTEHVESRQYEASGWWAYDEPGWVTHWMYMDVPEPPEK